jgi:hypothetical protein
LILPDHCSIHFEQLVLLNRPWIAFSFTALSEQFSFSF